ncbi:hypothetical protein [uncultured Maribacter sp.]|uniref:hypothetical protein n=1 Tax=uncultured Maribacter sp. TaxID=431308 RepID=UPI002632F908|nr:hypothetical protein [uncultured Maribacter sp.]
MNKLIWVFAFSTLLSCNKEIKSEQPIKESHIQYFGFTLIDTYWDDPTDDQTKTNYLDEVNSFSNIADILVANPTDNIVSRMTKMNNLEVKSILHVSELFFELIGTNSPSGAKYALRTDYKLRWDEFISRNNIEENKNIIQSFYIGEEPTWNGISFSELKSATDYVKLTIPTVPILIIEAYPSIDKLTIPNSVDWIGFDYYFIKDPKTNQEYINRINTLKTKFSNAEQKLVIVMDTHYITSVHGDFSGISLNEMGNVADSYYEIAKSQPKTIAILGYFWPSGFDDPESIGARNMPNEIKENYIRIGKEITHKN